MMEPFYGALQQKKKKKKMPEGRCRKCRSVLKEIIPHANERFIFFFVRWSVVLRLYANRGGNVQRK